MSFGGNYNMTITEYQKWIVSYYNIRGWLQLDPFTRICFLTEEIGEVSQAVRNLEIGRDHPDEASLTVEQQKQHLSEELGDVLDNLLILAAKYDINFEDVLNDHMNKMKKRY